MIQGFLSLYENKSHKNVNNKTNKTIQNKCKQVDKIKSLILQMHKVKKFPERGRSAKKDPNAQLNKGNYQSKIKREKFLC